MFIIQLKTRSIHLFLSLPKIKVHETMALTAVKEPDDEITEISM